MMTSEQRSVLLGIGTSFLAGLSALPGLLGTWWLSRTESVHWAYSLFNTPHPLNFGGNPMEVYSHLLDLVFMGTGALVTGWTLFLRAFLGRRLPQAASNVGWLPALLLFVLAACSGGLDSQHGEGATMPSIVVFFCPTLTLCAWFLSGTALEQLSTWQAALLCSAFTISVWLTQSVIEHSVSGGPNMLAFVFCPGLVFGCFLIRRFNPRPPADLMPSPDDQRTNG